MKENTKKFRPPEPKAGQEWSDLNIEYVLKSLDEVFRSSGNPVYAWNAICFCSRADEPLPHWVLAYLAECAERMMLNDHTSDLRAVLPKVLGFPKKKKSGPGKLLRPFDPDEVEFTHKFLTYIARGNDPKTARSNACDDMSPEFSDRHDDRALEKILLDGLGLQKPPAAELWKILAYHSMKSPFYHSMKGPLPNLSATEQKLNEAIEEALAKKARKP
jgi:hypothetical protein